VAQPRLEKYRPILALGLFLIAWWVLPTAVKSFIEAGFSTAQAPSWIASSHMEDLESFWAKRNHSKVELIEAGQQLARQKAFYQLQAQRNEALRAEVRRLEDLLDLPSRRRFRYEVARVVRRDLGAWWQKIVIRKGRDHDIPQGAAVVFAGGVVGRVAEVEPLTSVVRLVTSPNFRMAATFAGDDRPVVYQGVPQTGFSRPQGEVRDAPQDLVATRENPKRLVSTSLGGAFPAGLTIGRVPWLEPDASGIFQTGRVRLDNRLLRLHEVAVLVPIQPEGE